MPTPVVRTYGKRGAASSSAVKRKQTSDLVDDDEPLAGPSTTAAPATGVPEKRRRLETSSPLPKGAPETSGSSTGATKSAAPRPASPTKLSQRMLGRSKTESSIPDDSPSRDNKRTPSLPTFEDSAKADSFLSPTKETQRPSFLSPLRATSSLGASSSLSASTAPAAIKTSRTTVTRTYAGQSRSFLVPLSNLSGDRQPSQTEEIGDEFSRESYASLRERWGVDNTSDDEHLYDAVTHSRGATPSSGTPSPTKSQAGRGKFKFGYSQGTPSKSKSRKDGSPSKSQLPAPPPLPSNMMNPLKSITELRNKGESRRFLDEVAYLLDGMAIPSGNAASGSKQAPNLGLIKASALELVTKLTESDFSRKAKAADIYGRVYDLLVDAGAGRGTDKTLDTILLTFLVLLARDPTCLIELAETYPASSAHSTTSTRPNTPNTLLRNTNSKGKGKSPSATETLTRSLVDILFTLLQLYTPAAVEELDEEELPTDPLVLASRETYTDAHFKRAGIAKKDKGMITTLHKTLSSLSIPGSKGVNKQPDCFDTPTIVVALLHLLPPSFLPANSWRADSLVKSTNVNLGKVLRASTSTTPRSGARRKVEPKPNPQNWFHLHIHLHLLDQYLLNQWGSVDGPVDDAKEGDAWATLVDELFNLGRDIAERTPQSDDLHDDVTSRCLETLLRVLVNLTHGEVKWGRRIVPDRRKGHEPQLSWLTTLVKESADRLKAAEVPSTKVQAKAPSKQTRNNRDSRSRGNSRDGPEDTDTEAADTDPGAVTDDEEAALSQEQERMMQVERRARALDLLCLGLALLMNLAQVLDNAGDLMQESGTLEALCSVYEQQGELAEGVVQEGDEVGEQAQADASFLRGHLSVLFGLLMRLNEDNKEIILQLLPRRGESWKLKLTRLVDQAKRFVSFFDVVQASQQQEGLNEDEKSEKKVAQEVVGFLVELRDDL